MAQILLQIPTWLIIRVLGVSSYMLLFFGMCAGVLYSMPKIPKTFKIQLYRFHHLFVWSSFVAAILHALFLIIDTFSPFSISEILIPFTAKTWSYGNGLGTVVLYGLLIVLLSSDFRQFINRKLWKLIHFISYPMFIFAMIHGMGGGTDTELLIVMYFLTGLIMVSLFIMRFSVK